MYIFKFHHQKMALILNANGGEIPFCRVGKAFRLLSVFASMPYSKPELACLTQKTGYNGFLGGFFV